MRTATLGAILLAMVSLTALGCQEKRAAAPAPAKAAAPEGSATPNETPAPPGKPAAIVTMTNGMRFTPAKVMVEVGQTVEWQNKSIMTHTVTGDRTKAVKAEHVFLPPGARSFDSGSVGPGKTFSYAFTLPGTYRYFCIPHEAMGMLGEVEVKPAATKPAP
jgi:plastocyanin